MTGMKPQAPGERPDPQDVGLLPGEVVLPEQVGERRPLDRSQAVHHGHRLGQYVEAVRQVVVVAREEQWLVEEQAQDELVTSDVERDPVAGR